MNSTCSIHLFCDLLMSDVIVLEQVWSGHLGKPLHCLGKEEDGQVKCVALSPEGETLAVGYHEGDIKFYEVQTGR